jgi:hypothetical protein
LRHLVVSFLWVAFKRLQVTFYRLAEAGLFEKLNSPGNPAFLIGLNFSVGLLLEL